MKKDFNEPELSRHLGPVKAPDELWDRVHGAEVASERRHAPDRRPRAWQWATVAVTAMAVAAGVTIWLNRSLSSEEIAVRALGRTRERMEFRSENLTELRTWVKTGTGLDVPLPSRTSPAVRLIGARVGRAGIQTAEISYQVGDTNVALVVSKAPPDGDGRHTIVKTGSYHGADFLSWTMRGQMYTIAAADAKVGCILCHSTGAPRTREN